MTRLDESISASRLHLDNVRHFGHFCSSTKNRIIGQAAGPNNFIEASLQSRCRSLKIKDKDGNFLLLLPINFGHRGFCKLTLEEVAKIFIITRLNFGKQQLLLFQRRGIAELVILFLAITC